MKNALFILLLFGVFSTFGQVTLSDSVARLVLKDLAELDSRREIARIDSATIQDLLRAYQAGDSALTYAKKSIDYLQGIIVNDSLIESELHKEVWKERRKRKAVTIGGVALVVLALLL